LFLLLNWFELFHRSFLVEATGLEQWGNLCTTGTFGMRNCARLTDFWKPEEAGRDALACRVFASFAAATFSSSISWFDTPLFGDRLHRHDHHSIRLVHTHPHLPFYPPNHREGLKPFNPEFFLFDEDQKRNNTLIFS